MGKPSLAIAIAAAGVFLPVACEQTLRTGKVGNTKNAPSADGTCPTGLSLCGKGAFAQCLDLQNDRQHCGACDNACLPGIACAAGACQQIACGGPVTVSTQTLPESVAPTDAMLGGALLADVNGDGRPDLVIWKYAQARKNTFQVALGQAGGGFADASTYQAANEVDDLLAADWNTDGFDDLYVVGAWGDPPCLEIWLGHADGKLTSTTNTGDIGCMTPTTVADLNGDGTKDMVAFDPLQSATPSVFLADADGTFHVGSPIATKHNGAMFLVRDWNGDGFPDLVTVAILSLYLNKGDGSFADETDCGVYLASNEEWRQVVIADFDRDGHMDVAGPMIEEGVGVLMGMGGCQFQPMTEYPLSGPVVSLVYADLDGDGLSDLVARTSDGTLSLLHGGVDGTFQVAPLASSGVCVSDCTLLVGDVTGDGRVDLVVPGGLEITGGGTQVVEPTQILGNTCQ